MAQVADRPRKPGRAQEVKKNNTYRQEEDLLLVAEVNLRSPCLFGTGVCKNRVDLMLQRTNYDPPPLCAANQIAAEVRCLSLV